MSSVQQQYRDGVAAFVETAGGLTETAWSEPACGDWSAEQLARHVLAVARWYHVWLDRAIDGETTRPFHSDDIDAHNEEEVTKLANVSGAAAVAEFEDTAVRYLERTTEHWDLAYPYPYGTVTVGLHCGLAASEWHIHTWDVSSATDSAYTPFDPAGLFRAASAAEAVRRGGLRGLAVRALAPLGATVRPWEEMLKWSGRG